MFSDLSSEDFVSEGGLIAVDVGLTCGLAWFDAFGSLLAVRAARFPSRGTLRRGALPVLRALRASAGVDVDPSEIVVEGDPRHARAWLRAGEQLGAWGRRIDAPVWRQALLRPADCHDGSAAKAAALRLATPLVEAAGVHRSGALTDDVAEAVCIGLWALGSGHRRGGGLA